jgi:hypothetical protein
MALDFVLSSGAFDAGEHIKFGLFPGESGPQEYVEVGSGGAVGGGSGLPEDLFVGAASGGAVGGGSALPEVFDSEVRFVSGGALGGGAALDVERGEGGAVGGGHYLERIQAACAFWYDIRGLISTAVEFPWTNRIVASYSAAYGILQSIAHSVALQYDLQLKTPVRAACSLAWNVRLQSAFGAAWSITENQTVRAAQSVMYSIRPIVRTATVLQYQLLQRVNRAVELCYGIPERDRVFAAHTGIWSLATSLVVNITDQPFLTYKGRRVGILGGDISASEGGYLWEGNFVLADINDYVQFLRDEEFTADLYGEVWTFIVDGKELERSGPAKVNGRIIGVSPGAAHAAPRTLPQDYEWDVPVLAQDAAEEALGEDIDWQIVDWTIPAFRLSFSSTDSIEVVRRLATAAGALLESDLDGALRVRPLFPISPANYAAEVPDHVYTELPDIIGVSESYNYGVIANRFRIMDVQQSILDTLEWVEDSPGAWSGYIKAYMAPWRLTVQLVHTGDTPTLTIGIPATVVREVEEELVEVFKGQGSVRYPIYDVLSVEWEATNLGGIVHAVDSKEFTVVGPAANSLVRIKYRTRSLNHRVVSTSGRPTQFLLESTT